jgi:CubicO group peptidase (beta-lactamase class C family)
LSRAAGQPYADHVQEQIVAPLGMRHTRFEPDKQMIPNLAEGYVLHDGLADPRQPAEELRKGRGYKVPNGAMFTSVKGHGSLCFV